MKQVWFVGDASAAGKLVGIRNWWNNMTKIGPEYGYFPNTSKTWLIVKVEHLEEAKELFQDTGVKISYDGKSHLGSAIGSRPFVESFVEEKVSKWKKELEHLSDIATTQPQAAYTAFTHGIKSKWIYLARTTPNIELAPLKEVIRCKFLPAITGQSVFDDNPRNLMRLTARLGGLGVIDPSQKGSIYYENSKSITTPLVNVIIDEARVCPSESTKAQINAKNQLRNSRRLHEKVVGSEIIVKLSPNLQRPIEISSEKGASTWLTTLPLADFGFTLHKAVPFVMLFV